MKKVLLTGGAGFIGHHTIEGILKKFPEDTEVIVLDRLSYAGDLNRITDMEQFSQWRKEDKIKFVYHDIRAPILGGVRACIGEKVDYIINMAAETFVDRAIADPEPFVQSNVIGTFNMLEFARGLKKGSLKAFFQISTDEVYGPAPVGVYYKEWDRLKPSNPYSATKAAADCLAYSYYNTYRLPVIITRTMNNFGERQHPEKLIGSVLKSLIADKEVIVHGASPAEVGIRSWLHARNHADALIFLLKKGIPGDIYNITGEEFNNMDVIEKIVSFATLPARYKFVDFQGR